MSKIHILKKPSHNTLTEQLQQLMATQGLNEADLARKTNIPQPTLHKILAGKTADPRASTLKILAGYFNISVDQLISGTSLHQRLALTETQSVPIISWQDCIRSPEFIQNLAPSSWNDWIVIEYQADNVYALLSKPSMEPRFPKGTILIVDAELEPMDGDLIVVHYPETPDATLREFSSDGPTKLLLPIGMNAEKKQLTSDMKILGVVVQSRFSYYK